MLNTQVVILAGGLGMRLRPITEKIPKVLVEVQGQPFLTWQLEFLRRQGVKRVLLLCGYLGEMVRVQYGERFGEIKVSYSFEDEPLGTGGALTNAKQELENVFVLINGDSFLPLPLDQILEFFQSGDFKAVVSVGSNKGELQAVPENIKVSDAHVTAYEKGAGAKKGFQVTDSGVYVLKKEILKASVDALDAKNTMDAKYKKFQLEELWPSLIKESKLGAFMFDQPFFDIGTAERLKIFEEHIHDYF